MKYDDASWHSGGEFPAGLPHAAAATHTGMFLAWSLLSGLGGTLFADEEPHLVDELRARVTTPGAFFLKHCDGKFLDEDLNDLGNRFAQDYFNLEGGAYLDDYDDVFGGDAESIYHVPDTWASFDRIRPTLERRFSEWRTATG